MSDLNNFSFTGRLTKDASFKTLPSGKTGQTPQTYRTKTTSRH